MSTRSTERPCAKRPKGLGDQNPRRMSAKAISNQPRRCRSRGGSSGKSNNGGRAPRWEQSGVFSSPGKRRPHRVSARSI